MDIREVFISEAMPYRGRSKRDKFLSRIFGIFNEDIVRIWCKNNNSPFIDLGRPTVYDADGKYYTLDFLLKCNSGHIFLGEMKCEIEYQKYRYLTLNEAGQLDHHRKKRAFQLLLEIATAPHQYKIKCGGNDIEVNGSALIWGRVSPEGETSVKTNSGISHVLSTEAIIGDLIDWKDEDYFKLIGSHFGWCNELFSGLLDREY